MHSDVTDKDQTSQLLHKEVNSLKTSLSAANQLSANLKKELETLNHDIVDSNEKLATASARCVRVCSCSCEQRWRLCRVA